MQAPKTEILQNFGARLKAAMSRRGVTLQQIAEHCEVAVSTVGAWTQGKNWPAVELQPRLAAFLGSSIPFLFHGIATEKTEGDVAEKMESPPANSGNTEAMERQVRQEFETTVKAADGRLERLGWMLEVMRMHLRPPAHWRRANVMSLVEKAAAEGAARAAMYPPGEHPAVKEAEMEGERAGYQKLIRQAEIKPRKEGQAKAG